MGVVEDIEAAMETDGGDAPAAPEKKYLIDTVYMKHPRKGMELVSFLKDGMGRWTADQSMSSLTWTNSMDR